MPTPPTDHDNAAAIPPGLISQLLAAGWVRSDAIPGGWRDDLDELDWTAEEACEWARRDARARAGGR